MIPARITLWLMLYFSIICDRFLTNNLNIAIISMVEYSEAVAENITGVCKNAQALPSNTTYTQKINFQETNSQITFEWSKEDRNLVLGAFNAFSWIPPFLGGFFAHKYGAKLVVGWCTFVASMMASLIPFAAPISPILVAVVRAIQGMILSTALPAGLYPVAGKWYPAHERGKFFTVLSAFSIGTTLSFSIFGFIVDIFGWPYVFYVTSLCGFLWFLLWQYFVYDSPHKHPRISIREKSYIENALGSTVTKEKLPIPWKAIFMSRPFIINIICQVGAGWGRFVYSMYLPTYFKLIHGLNSKESGLVSGLPYLLRAGCSCTFAVISDLLLKKEILSTMRLRNLATFVSSIVSGSLLIGEAFAYCNTSLAIAFASVSIMMSGAFTYGAAAGIVDMSPNFCGVLTGIAAAASATMGIFIPLVVTLLSNVYGTYLLEQWKMVWLLTGSIYIITGLIFILWSESELQPWNAVHYEPGNKKLLQKL